MEKIRVMFLCTSNSCCSQMAEGWARELAGNILDVKSAGIDVNGQNERAIKVMAEVGIDISQQQPALVNGDLLEWSDLVVTLCDNAEEQCPTTDSHTHKMHLPLPNPEKFRGTEKELTADFIYIRDKVKQRVLHIIDQLAD